MGQQKLSHEGAGNPAPGGENHVRPTAYCWDTSPSLAPIGRFSWIRLRSERTIDVGSPGRGPFLQIMSTYSHVIFLDFLPCSFWLA
jgi:hypothetical protein